MRPELTCESCGKKFFAKQNHGKWPRFCSRECWAADKLQPIEKNCATCGCVFTATKTSHESGDGYRKYCSVKCQKEGIRNGKEYVCPNCGVAFYMTPAQVKHRGDNACCSDKCADTYYTGTRCKSYKRGFYKHSGTNEKYVYLDRPGYSGKYTGEHRVVAAKEIGRPLIKGEFVIRLNRNINDNRPENLFICESNSEFSKRRNGSLPWPSESNLKTYAANMTANNQAHLP